MKPAMIETEHYYNHKPTAIWKCLTDPKFHAQWWAAGNVKAEVGHKFELDMGPFGKQACEVLKVEKDRLFQYRFALNTMITWEVISEGEGTRLKLKHEGFDLESPMGKKAFEGMSFGWPRVLERMQPVLEQL